MKTLKVNVPDGYEIDKEKSTSETIVFKKKKNEVVIRWDDTFPGVEIKADGEHFVVDANPSYAMNWNDAVRFYPYIVGWKLPTIKQLQVIAKYLDRINDVIRENNGFEIHSYLWSCEEDEFCAWYVLVYNGYTNNTSKGNDNYVRAVYDLSQKGLERND